MKRTKLFKFCALALALALCLCMTVTAADIEGFVDAAEEDYFYPALQWALEEGITQGVDETHFAPEGEVTRAQLVTFLWRMAGRPEAEATVTFTDVEAGSWYEPALQWAVESGITEGTGDGAFSPDAVCNRAMCLTLLYRLSGSPMDEAAAADIIEFGEDTSLEDMTMEEFVIAMTQQMIKMIREADIFPDVPEGAYYELPVIWGTFNGIITEENTGAMEEGMLFHSEEPCLRAQMLSFLYQTKKMQDMANAPETYELDSLTIPFPQEYSPLLYREVYGVSSDEDEEGVAIIVSELASREAAEALGEDPEGIGELFRILYVGEDTLHAMLCSDMSGLEVFARDEDGRYYIFCHPTDVRYMRETTEKMQEDVEQWTSLNEWAYGALRDGILQYSPNLAAVTFTNTTLDIALSRAAYQEDAEYTVSTTEFGPLEKGGVDATPYVEFLLGGNFTELEEATAPDGEYVTLSFPEEDVRFDFFVEEPNLVREVRGTDETFYERSLYSIESYSIDNTEIMQGWYDALAEQAGKKKEDTSLDAFLGTWNEEIAGRAMLTITKSLAPGRVAIEASWPDSAYVMHTWAMTAERLEDGSLFYTDARHYITEFNEDGEGLLIGAVTGESGSLALDDDGKLLWQYEIDEESEEGLFIRADE